MEIKLVSHINGDGDLLPAWFKYYTGLGVTAFHIIVHGSEEENALFFKLAEQYPVVVEHHYKGEFQIEEKKRHLQKCLDGLVNTWVVAGR